LDQVLPELALQRERSGSMMEATMSRCLFFARLAILFASFTASADEVILLDPSADRQTEFQVPLFGYREFPQQIFTSQKGENFGLPTELIYTSASRIPEVEEEATSKGTDIFDLDAGQVVALLRSRSVDEIAPTPGISRPTTNIPWTESSEVDAAFVTALVSSELVRSDFSIFYGEIIGDKAVEMISVDREVAKDFWDAYSNLEGLKM
jgi:hypothetical protein